MPPPGIPGPAAKGIGNDVVLSPAASGAGSLAALDPGRLRPPPSLDDLPVLKLLQQGDLFGSGGGYEEVPLLVPLSNGAVTNMYGGGWSRSGWGKAGGAHACCCCWWWC